MTLYRVGVICISNLSKESAFTEISVTSVSVFNSKVS